MQISKKLEFKMNEIFHKLICHLNFMCLDFKMKFILKLRIAIFLV